MWIFVWFLWIMWIFDIMITSLNHLLKVYLTRSALPRPVDVQLTNGQIDKDDLKFRTDDMDKSDMSSPPATGSTGSQADGTDETLFQSAQAERPSNPEVLCALNINISEDVALLCRTCTFWICVLDQTRRATCRGRRLENARPKAFSLDSVLLRTLHGVYSREVTD
jgi:hypothetical protein